MVDLGTAKSYAVLSGSSVGNTVSAVGAPHTTIRGGLGVSVNTPPIGFPPGIVTGAVDVGNAAAAQAHTDLVAAYDEVKARTGGTPLAGALAGAIITPGLYSIAAAVANTGTVTLDGRGDPNAVFVFQVNGALNAAAGSHVALINEARASRVFWQVAGAAAIGANADFAGTLMVHDAVAVGNDSLVNGRALALTGALTLDDDQFYGTAPVVTIAGGASAITNDPAPTIRGVSDVESPGVVTVKINGGDPLTATPSGGTWSLPGAISANGTYTITVTVTDAAGNSGSATQLLTVDTVPPHVTIDGGATAITRNPTPTIGGDTDILAPGFVTTTIDGQTLMATPSGAAWSVPAASLADGAYAIVSTVTDAAGNVGSATQLLTVDTVPPHVTINGGATAITSDPTPTISGTTDVEAPAVVSVTINRGNPLTATPSAGAWTVPSAITVDGTYSIVSTVSDVAGNETSATQQLTVDATPPLVTITGGATAITNDRTPTISGTTDVEAPAVVTITINGETLAAIPSGGTWSAVPAARLGYGPHAIVGTVTDPAGNEGNATQQLTVAPVPPLVTIDGGPSAITNDPTPAISGTSDVAPGTVVNVAVGSQTLTALVQAAGTWSVTSAALIDGTRLVTASVTAAAGGVGLASQVLTVDTAAPAIMIVGGANALIGDATPEISGTADVSAGTMVTVSLADQTLVGLVGTDGTWSVLATALSEGAHRVTARVSDSAGNSASFTQTLTVDSVPPAISITCGPTATANDRSPTIAGTTDASPGTTISVSIGRQMLTTLVQANGTWNATPAPLALGTWAVVVRARDLVGNLGSAKQTLTLAAPASANGNCSIGVAARATVTVNDSQKAGASLLSIRATVSAPVAGRIVVVASGSVKIIRVKTLIGLAKSTATVGAGRSATLRLTMKGSPRAVRRALTRITAAIHARTRVTATITIRIVDSAGAEREVRRTVNVT